MTISLHEGRYIPANPPNVAEGWRLERVTAPSRLFGANGLRTGPDGSVYMTDFYDPQICHNTDASIWDRTHGRIYKVVHQGTPQPQVGHVTFTEAPSCSGMLNRISSLHTPQATLRFFSAAISHLQSVSVW